MKEVFLIMNNPCDYESSPRAIGFKESEEEANSVVQYLTERYHRLRNMSKEFDDMFALYNKENPFDVGILPERKTRKPWPSGLGKNQITEEMRKEKEEIQEFNASIDKEYSYRYSIWQSKRTEILKPLIEAKPKEFQEQVELRSGEYFFKNVPWLKKEQPYFVEKLNEFIIK